MKREFISPKGVHEPIRYSHAVKVGNIIYVSGQAGINEKGRIVEGGFEEQALQVFENLKCVLQAAGASLKDVVKINGYFTNYVRDFDKYHEIRSRFFKPPLPAATHVEIAGFAFPEMLLEIDAIAVLD